MAEWSTALSNQDPNAGAEEKWEVLVKRITLLETQMEQLRTQSAELERRVGLEAAMLHSASRISASLSFNEVVKEALEGLERLVPVQRSCLMLYNPASEELEVVITRGETEAGAPTRFKKGEGIEGWVAQTGQPAIAPASYEDPMGLRLGRVVMGQASVACVPLRAANQVLGVLRVDRPVQQGRLTEEELNYLTFLADYASAALNNARLHEKSEKRAQQLSSLYEVGSALGAVRQVDRVLNRIVEAVTNITGAEICSLMLLDRSGQNLRIRVAKGLSPGMARKVVVSLGHGIAGHVAKTGEPLLINDIETHPLFKRKNRQKYTSRSLLTVPLTIRGQVIGVLNVNNKQPEGDIFTEDDQNLLSLFASQAAIAIENARLYEDLAKLAVTDGLTGLVVQRAFQERLERELRRAKRWQHALSLMILDLDDFKRVNDLYGHQTGDAVLKEVAQVIQKRGWREGDVVARYGGEEFALVVVETDKVAALKIGEEVRRGMEAHEFIVRRAPLRLTLSVGVANYPEDAETKDDLVKVADNALYHAKHAGRNCVAFLQEGSPQLYQPSS